MTSLMIQAASDHNGPSACQVDSLQRSKQVFSAVRTHSARLSKRLLDFAAVQHYSSPAFMQREVEKAGIRGAEIDVLCLALRLCRVITLSPAGGGFAFKGDEEATKKPRRSHEEALRGAATGASCSSQRPHREKKR